MTLPLFNKTTRFWLFTAAIGLFGLFTTHRSAMHYQEQVWQNKLSQYARQVETTLAAELAKYQQIPQLLSQDPRLIAKLSQPESSEPLNPLLMRWAIQTQADTIYLHDPTGVVIGSSNHQQADSFIGADFSFRPYFIEALSGKNAHYVALGVRSNKRGFFFAAPIKDPQHVIGVLTTKVSLESLESTITDPKMDVAILDRNLIVFLTNLDHWRYSAMAPLSDTTQQYLVRHKQYGNQTPTANTELQLQDAQRYLTSPVTFADDERLWLRLPERSPGFQVLSSVSRKHLFQHVLQADLIFTLLFSLALLITFAWRQTLKHKVRLTKLNQQLEDKVAQRTHTLSRANHDLQQTINRYKQTQQALIQTEKQLTQAAKLALLGELSASINHEINQPLAALRTYTENSQKLMSAAQYTMVEQNLATMLTLNQNIAEVIARLKEFTRKSDHYDHNLTANLNQAVNRACAILANRLIKQGITLKIQPLPELHVSCHPTELEQVILNLVHNAAQALNQTPNPCIHIRANIGERDVQLCISDNGPGVSPEALTQLFEPFYTSKPEGLGLGLPISKRIIERYQGHLMAERIPNSGMRFTLSLPTLTPQSGEPTPLYDQIKD